MSATCSHCQAALLPAARFCGECGHAVAAERCPHCARPLAADAVYCTHCGRAVAAGAHVAKAGPPPTTLPFELASWSLRWMLAFYFGFALAEIASRWPGGPFLAALQSSVAIYFYPSFFLAPNQQAAHIAALVSGLFAGLLAVRWLALASANRQTLYALLTIVIVQALLGFVLLQNYQIIGFSNLPTALALSQALATLSAAVVATSQRSDGSRRLLFIAAWALLGGGVRPLATLLQ